MIPGCRTLWEAVLPLSRGCVLALVGATASAADVLVVTDRQHLVRVGFPIRVIELDAPEQLVKSELAAHLPVDLERAATIARQRLQDGGSAFQKRLVAACQGVVEAWRLGVTKIPAVVVDRRYVVYGVPDVNRALELIDQYRSAQP
jgi:integrating conjugative element protein (TIGR03757 family)